LQKVNMNLTQIEKDERLREARLSTMEQTKRVQRARVAVEAAEAELRREQAALNNAIGAELDAWHANRIVSERE
jgi:hypothetical protein